MTRRSGTVGMAALLVGSVGLWWVYGAFVPLTLLVVFVWGLGAGASRMAAFSDPFHAVSWTYQQPTLVWFPIGRRVVRHNERVRMRRRVGALESGAHTCEALINDCREPHEQSRIPVLEAERDAARRQAARIEEDLVRLEASWDREEREREYRRLTA